MRFKTILGFIAMCLFVIAILPATAQQPQSIPMPQPTVPQMFTLQGQYVRMAYNNEGFATLGYRAVQQSVGGDWILLRVGITVRKDVPNYELKREHLTVKLPNGTTVPLATQKEFMEAGGVRAVVLRDQKIHDSINYFPNEVSDACAIKFFNDPGQRGLAYDQVELSDNRGCVGRLFFKVPGGIVPGQYWLLIQFAKSHIEVPFRVMTPEEEKMFRDQWDEIKEFHENSMKQK